MNKLLALLMIAVVSLTVLSAYWYVKPHHMPRFLSDLVPGLKVPTLKSPVATFRPPQF